MRPAAGMQLKSHRENGKKHKHSQELNSCHRVSKNTKGNTISKVPIKLQNIERECNYSFKWKYRMHFITVRNQRPLAPG